MTEYYYRGGIKTNELASWSLCPDCQPSKDWNPTSTLFRFHRSFIYGHLNLGNRAEDSEMSSYTSGVFIQRHCSIDRETKTRSCKTIVLVCRTNATSGKPKYNNKENTTTTTITTTTNNNNKPAKTFDYD